MGNRGFTLIEILVVITLAGILATFATLSWNTISQKIEIEEQIKLLHADMMSARMESLYGKRARTVIVSGKVFSIYSSTVTTVTPVVTSKTFKYDFLPTGANSVTFDTSGLANGNERTICVVPDGDTTVVNDASVDSVVISQARLNLGKRTGGNCDTSHVTQK